MAVVLGKQLLTALMSSRRASSSVAGSDASIGTTFVFAVHSITACVVAWVAVIGFGQTAFLEQRDQATPFWVGGHRCGQEGRQGSQRTEDEVETHVEGFVMILDLGW